MAKTQASVLFMSGVGLFTIVAAALNWGWFMNHHKARFWVSLFGYQGARAFYMVLGTVLLFLGIFLAF